MKRITRCCLPALLFTAIAATSANATPPAPYNWTGCYVGGNVGYASAHEQWTYGYYAGTDYNLDYGSHSTKGALGGGQVGCNYQMGMWVVGLEGEFDAAGMKGNHEYVDYFQSTKLNWIATAALRFGYAMNNSLFYVKGGGAWDRGSYDMMLSGISYSDSITRSGWLVGAGWEFGLTQNWSVKVEYDHIMFGSHDVWWNYQYATPPDPWSFHIKQSIDVVKLGVNYRFNPF
jgi:outer membrane immunogenic protein